MANCHHCGKTILFGGRTVDGARYCGTACASRHPLLARAAQVPEHVLQKHVEDWHRSACPRCNRPGPIDLYHHHRVHSFVLLTRWHTRQSVSCRRCGRRSQIASALYSAALGWWGLPWGLLMTPLQVGRNLAAACRGAPQTPSEPFRRLVRLQLAQQTLAPPAQD